MSEEQRATRRRVALTLANEPPENETLYDQPITDGGKVRVTGPFTGKPCLRRS